MTGDPKIVFERIIEYILTISLIEIVIVKSSMDFLWGDNYSRVGFRGHIVMDLQKVDRVPTSGLNRFNRFLLKSTLVET